MDRLARAVEEGRGPPAPRSAAGTSRSSRPRRRSRATRSGPPTGRRSAASRPGASTTSEWADALVFGSPTRFGNVAAQVKQFLDQAGGLREEGKLADKVASGFTSAQNPHGGQETTLMALYATMFHWGRSS